MLLACAAPDGGAGPSGRAPFLEGTVSDADGVPLAGATVQACESVCAVTETDLDGRFRFDELWEASWSLHATGPPPPVTPATPLGAPDAWAELVVPVAVPGPPVDVVVPRLGAAVPVDGRWAEVAPGLRVELDPDALPGISAVRGAALDDWPAVLGVPGELVAGFTLSPSGAGTSLSFEASPPGDVDPTAPPPEVWCTTPEGTAWERCDVLPDLGSLVLLR